MTTPALALPEISPESDSAKRKQILDGARRCFLAKGFDGASMNDIVASAGVSKGTLYAYFPSKDKLFAAMVYDDKRSHVERTIVLGDENRPVEVVLRELAMKFIAMFSAPDSLAYIRLVIAASAKFPEIGRSFYEAGPDYAVGKLAAYFENQMQRGTIRRCDSRLAATRFIDLIQSGVTKPRLFSVPTLAETLGVETVVDSAVDLFLHGMVAKP